MLSSATGAEVSSTTGISTAVAGAGVETGASVFADGAGVAATTGVSPSITKTWST